MKKYNYRISCKTDPRFDMVGTHEAESSYSATIKIINLIFNKAKELDIIEKDLPESLEYSGWPNTGEFQEWAKTIGDK